VKSADANNAGQLLELDAILAVTLGGTALTGGRFQLAGTVIGALIIQTLTSMIYSLGVPPEVNLVVKAALVFAVMLLQSAEFRGVVARVARGGSAA
jgi:simple sugar transport system permease protein